MFALRVALFSHLRSPFEPARFRNEDRKNLKQNYCILQNILAKDLRWTKKGAKISKISGGWTSIRLFIKVEMP
jgi:hypothetical protein